MCDIIAGRPAGHGMYICYVGALDIADSGESKRATLKFKSLRNRHNVCMGLGLIVLVLGSSRSRVHVVITSINSSPVRVKRRERRVLLPGPQSNFALVCVYFFYSVR